MFIDVEEAIITRLNSKLAALTVKPKVYAGADIAEITDRSHRDAAVYVAYNGIVLVEPLQGNPAVLSVTLEYIIWVVTRSASRHDSQQGNRSIADPIVVGVLEALSGWRPATGLPALVLADSPGQAYVDGAAFFPVTFRLKRQIRGTT